MGMRDEFLADIIADPDDDAPRLIYADWLEDNGDPDRAEFIRVQIERARLPDWDAAQVRLRVREEQLLAKYRDAWRAELPQIDGVVWGYFRRGLVASASFRAFGLLGEAGWRIAAPIKAAGVPWPTRGDGAEWIEPIPGLRRLTIGRRLVAMADADRLAASPLLSTLRVLEMKEAALGVEGLRHVLSSPHLGRLEALRIPDNGIGDGVGAALRSAPSLDSLEELDLSADGESGYYGEDFLTSEGMSELAT
jgi:uncharacterized protein (TIGR02996 family)